jgi:hypothetical protein
VWNASLVVAEGIERASVVETLRLSENGSSSSRVGGEEGWNPRWWNVRGKRVLELGAGMSLCSSRSSALPPPNKCGRGVKLSYGRESNWLISCRVSFHINRHSPAVYHQQPLQCLQCHHNRPPLLACSHHGSHSGKCRPKLAQDSSEIGGLCPRVCMGLGDDVFCGRLWQGNWAARQV